jgi:acetyltransferase-like isoleucine patch superfamily enzyme
VSSEQSAALEPVVPGDLRADPGVVLGYAPSRTEDGPLILGNGAHLRSGTTLYAGSHIGHHLETGHNVVIREACIVGDNVSIWSNTIVDYRSNIGDNVKIHVGCYVAQFSEIGEGSFLAPGVVFANDLYPSRLGSAEAMHGPIIGKRVVIGVNSTVLPFVRIGDDAMIGAGSVVTRDVPAGYLAFGNPAACVRRVDELNGDHVRSAIATRSSVSRGDPS